LTDHEGLLQIAGGGAVDPRQDDAVHLNPHRPLGKRLVLEDMAGEGVLPEHGEEHPTPLGVGVRRLVEDDGDESLDVDNGGGLRPESFVGRLVLGEGLIAEAEFLVTARFLSAGSLLGLQATGVSGLGSGCGRDSVVRGVVIRHGEVGPAAAPDRGGATGR
jgi:hypothetical protein